MLGLMDPASFCPQDGLEIINSVYWIHQIGLHSFYLTEVSQFPKPCDKKQNSRKTQKQA